MDKNTLLSRIDEKSIYFRYLNINEIPKKNISSPFSEDKNPSFSIYEKNKKLLFKCHSSDKHGDCFQLVQDLLNLDFNDAIKTIAEDFNLTENIEINHFKYHKIDFTEKHLEWWLQGNWAVNELTLRNYSVFAIDKFEFYQKSIGKIKESKIPYNAIAFCYSNNGNKGEIYIPKQKIHTPKQTKYYKKKFILNKFTSDDIFGINQLGKVDDLIICAGKKDCLILNANGFPAICFRSENHHVKDEQMQLIKSKSKNIYVLYDNDIAGQKSAKKISEKYSIDIINLPQNFNDVADYFLTHNKIDFKKEFKSQKNAFAKRNDTKNGNTIFHQIEDYLTNYYDIRFNLLDLDLEIADKGLFNWKTLKIENLYIELKRRSFKFSIGDLQILLRSDYVRNYDPLKSYFENLPKWDGIDYIEKFSQHVDAENQERFNHHFKKWCVRTVKCAINDNYFNKQAFILADNGIGQNIGKSSWCRYLNPKSLNKYIAEDFSHNDKDSRILLCKNFLINLDELAQLNKKEINTLKSMFSKTQINERLPYDRKNSILTRKCSFIGSTNQVSFLNDETGSVRWLCFVIKKIDWNYNKINIDNLWSQAKHLLNDDDFRIEMTKEEISQNEIENSQFKILSVEQELIQKHYEKSNQKEGEFMTSTEILLELQQQSRKINIINIGKAMTALGHKRCSYKRTYGYWVKNRLF